MHRKRDSLEDKFTTMLKLGRWQPDLKLKANFKYLSFLYPKQDELFWFNYFWEQVKEYNCPLAQKHLLSYLEEISDICADKVQKKLEPTIFGDVVEYFFQEAREIVFNTVEFWRTYDSSRGKPLIYAQAKLESSLQERFINHRSNYGLLLWVSMKRLEEDLTEYGIWGTPLAQHLMVAIELKKIGAELPRKRKVIQEPTLDQLKKISQSCQELHKETFSPYQIKNILQNCIKALRRRQPWAHDPIDDREPPINENDDEILKSPEYSGIFVPVMERLITNPEYDILLLLGYGFVGINQELIGTIFSPPISQYTVSRKLERVRDNLQELFKQEFLNKLPNYPQLDIKTLNHKSIKPLIICYYRYEVSHEELEEWMRSHLESMSRITCLAEYYRILSPEDLQKLNNNEINYSQLNQHIKATKKKLAENSQEAARNLRITEEELLAKINSSTTEGIVYLSSWLGRRYGLSREFLGEIQVQLDQTIYLFFVNAPYADLAIGSSQRPNVLTQDVFAKIWKTEDEIPAAFPHLPISRLDPGSGWVNLARKVDIRLEITNYCFTLFVGFKEEEKCQYFIQIRIYPGNGQKFLPKNLGLSILEPNGNVFKQVQSKEADNWIQVEFRGNLKEEFQVKTQLQGSSMIENFVI